MLILCIVVLSVFAYIYVGIFAQGTVDLRTSLITTVANATTFTSNIVTSLQAINSTIPQCATAASSMATLVSRIPPGK